MHVCVMYYQHQKDPFPAESDLMGFHYMETQTLFSYMRAMHIYTCLLSIQIVFMYV